MKNVAEKFIAVLKKNVNETVVGAKSMVRKYTIDGTDYRVVLDGYYSHEGSMVDVFVEMKMGRSYEKIGHKKVEGSLSDIYYGMMDAIESIIVKCEKEWAESEKELAECVKANEAECVKADEANEAINATEEYINEQVDKVILNEVTADYFKYNVEKVENGYKVYAWLENNVSGKYFLADYGAVVRTRKEAEDWVINVGFDVQHYFDYLDAVEDSLRCEALVYGEQFVDAMFEGIEDMPNVADIPTISLGEDYSDFIATKVVDDGAFCNDYFYSEDGIYTIADNMDIEDYIFKSIAKRLNDYYPRYYFNVGDEWIEYKDVC